MRTPLFMTLATGLLLAVPSSVQAGLRFHLPEPTYAPSGGTNVPPDGNCHANRVRYCAGCTVTVTYTIDKGSICRIQHKFSAGALSTRTLVRPRHGVFAGANLTDQAYMVQRGYVGSDYFEYEITFRENTGGQSTVTIRNEVISR